MMRLVSQTGTLFSGPTENDTEEEVLRSGILVHEGNHPSMDGEIFFDEERIKRLVNNHNQKILNLAKQYGGIEQMPRGAYPAILPNHVDKEPIGRLCSLLRFEKRDVPGGGANLACAVADMVFLGQDTVQKVKDGRIYHLSIGIDVTTDTLGEVSTVVIPACPGSMLLGKDDVTAAAMKGGTEKMDAENTKGQKADSKAQVRRARLSAIQSALKDVKKLAGESSSRVRLEKKKIEITSSFKRLMSEGKLTPAEYKKMDLTQLSALSDDAAKTLFSVIAAREPVIVPGQIGSTQGVDFSAIGKSLEKDQKENLIKDEVLGDFKRLAGKKYKLKSMESSSSSTSKKEDEVEKEKEKEKEDESHTKKLAESDAAPTSADESSHTSAVDVMQGQIDELNTQVARIAGMVDELMGSDDDEEANDKKDDVESEQVTASRKEASRKED